MKKYVILVMVTLLSVCCSQPVYAVSTTQKAADLLVSVGERALEAGDLRAAIHEFSKALMLAPDHVKAKAYLSKFDIDQGIYTKNLIREDQLGEMARNIRDYKSNLEEVREARNELENRVMMLEDVIERKGDHKLLKDIEDYYRQAAFYDIDESLPKDEQLVALKRKHQEFREYAFDKDRYQDKYIDVAEALLMYKEDHLEDAHGELIGYKIDLAQNRRELLFRMDQVKRLSKEYDTYRENRYYDVRDIEILHNELLTAREHMDQLMHQRELYLKYLHTKVDTMNELL